MSEATTPLEAADAAMQAGDIDGAVAHLSAAVRQLTAEGDTRAAAMASARLADLFAYGLGNRVAAQTWFQRAWRLVEDDEPCLEQGWVAVSPMGCDVDDPALLWERAQLALDIARRFGDVDLEIKALADGGLARVQAGDVREGMAMIDEAMALACGTSDNLDVVARSVCSFYTACYYTADFDRAATWTTTFRQRGILGSAPGGQAFISSHCESVRATMLWNLGRWGEAETVLLQAHEAMERAMPGVGYHTPIALAELRLLQGRLDEAEVFLLGLDDHVQALIPTARLYLARGEADLACAAVRRGLRLVAGDRVRAAALLGVAVEAGLALGDVDGAAEASADLDARVAGLGVPALEAESARVRAKVLLARGDDHAAADALRSALDAVAGAELPLLQLRLHLDLAALLEGRDHAGAVVEGRAAGALLHRLDVAVADGDHALLARLGVGSPATRATGGVATLARDGDWWTASCGPSSVRLRDTKGLRYLAELVARPGTERHVLDLVDAVEGVSPDGVGRRRLGDAGPMADAASRNRYRQRVIELRDEVEDALAVEDDDRAAALQSELDAIVAELSRSFGIGGRERRASSAAEKARLNVTRAVRAAVAKLAGALPDAGAVLDRRIRTGTYCAYEPHPDDAVAWRVQP